MVHGANHFTSGEHSWTLASSSRAHLERVRWVIRHLAQLQGLRLIPLGVVFVASAAWRAGLQGWLPSGISTRTAFMVGLAGAVATSFSIQRWYQRHFGLARPRSSWRDMTGLLLLTAGLIASTSIGEHLRAVSLPGLFVGFALLSTLIASEGRRWHYGPVAASWFLFSIAAPMTLGPSTRDVLLDGLIGLSVIVCGLGDHRLLVSTLAMQEVYVWTD
jgi:hypothetical protein